MGNDLVTKCSIIAIGISVGTSLVLTLAIFFYKNENHYSNSKPQLPFENMIHSRDLYSQLPPYQPKRFDTTTKDFFLDTEEFSMEPFSGSTQSSTGTTTSSSPENVTTLKPPVMIEKTNPLTSWHEFEQNTTSFAAEKSPNMTLPTIKSLDIQETLFVFNGIVTNGQNIQIESANLSNLSDVKECYVGVNRSESFDDKIVGASLLQVNQNKHLIQCGGMSLRSGNLTSNCFYLNKSSEVLPRAFASSDIISTTNGSNMIFLAGGEDAYGLLNSTEIITINDNDNDIITVRGPDMPLTLQYHCLVFLNPDSIMVIGGRDIFKRPQENTYRLELNKTPMLWSLAPRLNQKRLGHSCGLLQLDGKRFVVAAGGAEEFMDFPQPLSTVEILNLNDGDGLEMEWITGPPMTRPMYFGSPRMLSLQSSLITVHRQSLFQLKCPTKVLDQCTWSEATQVWQNPNVLPNIFVFRPNLKDEFTCQ